MKSDNNNFTEYKELYELCKKELQSLDPEISKILYGSKEKTKSMYFEFMKLSKYGDLQVLALCLLRIKETLSTKQSEEKEEILKALADQVKDWIDVAEKVQYDKSELDEIRDLLKKLKKKEWLDKFLKLSRLENPIELLWHLKGYKATKKTDLPDQDKVLARYEEQIESWFFRAKENEHKASMSILKDRERDSLRKAVDKSSSSNKTFFVSYLSVLLYLVITVSNVTDEQFLLNKPVKLPWLNIEIPLFGFFIFAPLIFLATHFNVIYNLMKHIELIHIFANFAGRKDMEKIERFQLAPFLFNYLVLHKYEAVVLSWQQRIPAIVLELVAWLVLVIAPTILFSFVQVRFSSYQDIGFTLWHFMLFALDMILVSYFFWKVFITSWKELANKVKLSFHALVLAFLLLANIWNMKYLNEVLSLRSASSVPVLDDDFKNSYRFKLFPRLSIRGKELVASQPGELIQLGGFITGKDMEEFRAQNTKGIDAAGRNLIYAVFIECNITNANFKKSYLNGAVFFNTNIDRANFFNAEITDAQPQEELRALKGINKFREK
jgi:hypothetical protein